MALMQSLGPSLCTLCRSLFSHANFNAIDQEQNVINDYMRTDALPSLPSLQVAIDAGCKFCFELRKRTLAQCWPDGVPEITIGPAIFIHESKWESDLTPEQEGVWMIEVVIGSLETKRITLHFDLFARPGTYANSQLRVRRRPPSMDRQSAECIEILEGWISKCVETHWRCKSGDEEFWPTRVIDVGPADGTTEPKLVVTSGKASEYVALSHCWGKPTPGVRALKTLSTNIDFHQRGIRWDSMPRNYQHAICVTRRLGLRYLWIDSLCILQDSSGDWAKEGAQMDKIYKCALITLAATSASTSEDGFLDYMLKDRTFTLEIPYFDEEKEGKCSTTESTSRQLVVRYMEKQDSSRLEADVDSSTWNTRGWTLQERHLAPRLVHFSKSQIFWECRTGYESECGQRILHLPASISRARGAAESSTEESSEGELSENDSAGVLRSDDGSSSDSSIEQLSREEYDEILAWHRLYTWWSRVLADYSRRELTYASDKLPAISGLAKEVNTILQSLTNRDDTYVAGIWTGALTDGLLWMPEDPYAMRDPGFYRAPSWSWARWDGTIVPDTADSPSVDTELDMIEYVAHEVETNSANPYGTITRASLTLRASTTKVRLTGPNMQPTTRFIYGMHLSSSGVRIGLVALDHESLYEDSKGGLHALQIRVQTPQSGPARELHYSGLVLRALAGEPGFERIGVFILDEEHRDVFAADEKSTITLV